MNSFNPKIIAKMKFHCSTAKASRVLISDKISSSLHLSQIKRKQAAVLIPLCNRHGVPSVLFTVRTKKVGTHKGQVSFPGGHINEGETATEAAIRETYEELGLRIGEMQIIGQCQTIPAITGTLVTPVIGFFENDVMDFAHMDPSVDEVDKVFTRSIAELLDPTLRRVETLSRAGESVTMPVFGEDGEERIWGLTAMILDGVLRNVIEPNTIGR